MAVFKCRVCGNVMDIPENATNVLCDSCQTVQSVVQNIENSGIQPLLERAFMFIEDGAWLRADEYLEKILDQQPKNAEAYLGKLLLELRIKSKEELQNCPNPFDSSNNYQKAFRFGDEETRKFLTDTLEYIVNRNETNRKEIIYNNAKTLFDNANNEMAFRNAAKIFDDIIDYRDASTLKKRSLKKADTIHKDMVFATAKAHMDKKSISDQEKAISLFESIKGWKDADEQVDVCKQNIEDIKIQIEDSRKDEILNKAKRNMTQPVISVQEEAKKLLESISGWKDADEQLPICDNNIKLIIEKTELRKAELLRIEEEKKEASMKRKKKAKKISILVSVLLIVIAVAVAAFFLFVKPQIEYNKAVDLLNAAQYDQAREAFLELDDFKDAPEMVKEADYRKALSFLNQQRFDDAIKLFESLGDYSDSKAQIMNVKKALYEQAEKFFKEDKKMSAAMYFAKAIGYQDAQQRSFALWDEIAVRETVSAGSKHTVAVKNNGAVIATDFIDYGGYGNDHGQCNVTSWTNIIAVSAGGNHTVGLKADGTVVAVGNNDNSQCEVGSWKNIVAISAGNNFTAGLKADGTVVIAVNDINEIFDVSGWSDICAISAGDSHLVGLKKDGTVVATGNDAYGKCDVENWTNIIEISAGAYHTVGKTNNHKVVSTTFVGTDLVENNGQTEVSDWENILSVSAGGEHTVALTSAGTVLYKGNYWIMECDDCGEWGDVVAVSVGNTHIVALKEDGTIVADGVNTFGQIDVEHWTDIKLPK